MSKKKCLYCHKATPVKGSEYCSKHGGREHPTYDLSPRKKPKRERDLDADAKANRHDWNEGS